MQRTHRKYRWPITWFGGTFETLPDVKGIELLFVADKSNFVDFKKRVICFVFMWCDFGGFWACEQWKLYRENAADCVAIDQQLEMGGNIVVCIWILSRTAAIGAILHWVLHWLAQCDDRWCYTYSLPNRHVLVPNTIGHCVPDHRYAEVCYFTEWCGLMNGVKVNVNEWLWFDDLLCFAFTDIKRWLCIRRSLVLRCSRLCCGPMRCMVWYWHKSAMDHSWPQRLPTIHTSMQRWSRASTSWWQVTRDRPFWPDDFWAASSHKLWYHTMWWTIESWTFCRWDVNKKDKIDSIDKVMYMFCLIDVLFGLAQCISLMWAVLLPSVSASMYFYAKDDNDNHSGPVSDANSTAAVIAGTEEQSAHTTEKGDVASTDEKAVTPRFSRSKAFNILWMHFTVSYSNDVVIVWSIWWAIAMAGFLQVNFELSASQHNLWFRIFHACLQVQSYIQLLWKDIYADEEIVYNGAIEAAITLLGALGALAAGFFDSSKLKRYDMLILTGCSVIEGGLLICAAYTNSLWTCYAMYILFGMLYHFMITVARYTMCFLFHTCRRIAVN